MNCLDIITSDVPEISIKQVMGTRKSSYEYSVTPSTC